MVEVMSRVRTAMFRLVGQSAMLPTVERSGELAQLHRQLVFDDYSAGKCSSADLVEAARNDLEAALRVITTRYAYLESTAQLVHEVGWSPHEHNWTAGMELLSRLTAGRGEDN